jgi:hypothetical protein
MTLSRDFSSPSFDIPRRVSADLCLHVATLGVQLCSAASPALLIATGIPSHGSKFAVSGNLGVVFIIKTPFNTQ